MNRVRYVQYKCIRVINKLLVVILAALILLSTRCNIGFLFMQTYYYVAYTKDFVVKKVQTSGVPFLSADRIGTELGDYTYFVSGMVDPEFDCGLGGDKSKEATIIWNTCIEAGVNPEATAGIINNYFGEAHVWQYNGAYTGDPLVKAWCLKQIKSFNDGEMTPEQFKETKYSGGQSTAFGAWQWLGGRKLNLAKSARNAKADIGSVEFQITFMLSEIGVVEDLSDYDVRFGKKTWESFIGTATKTPKEYAEYFACYFEGYNGTTNLVDYQADTASNRNHTALAQKIYDAFMKAADEYAALHNTGGSATYSGSVLPDGFAQTYNIETGKMTEQRWKLVEKAYYWCDYGSGDYILYSQSSIGSVNRKNATWKDYDACVAQKSRGYIDCSKFVQQTYASIGINDVQDNTGMGSYAEHGFTQINADDLVAGDIIAHSGHVQIFLGWKDPNNHAAGYYKAAAHTWQNAEKEQVSIKEDTGSITNTKGWDSQDRAFRSKALPVGNGIAVSYKPANSTLDVGKNVGKKILLVGDSRTEGMCNAADVSLSKFGDYSVGSYQAKTGTNGNMQIICCVGAGVGLLQDSSVSNALTEAANAGETIVIALGVNDRQTDKYLSIIKKLSSKTNVYWCTAGPVVGRQTLQSSIDTFNDAVKKNADSTGYKVFDYDKMIRSCSYESGISSDGLHYSSSVNKFAYSTIHNTFCK